MTPAMRAVASKSPFGTLPWRRSAIVSAASNTQPRATATRFVSVFSETSTIRAAPRSSRCVSSDILFLRIQVRERDEVFIHRSQLRFVDDVEVQLGNCAVKRQRAPG